METKSPLRALFTVDLDSNEAVRHGVGDEQLAAVQIPRLQALVNAMNSGAVDPHLEELGLPPAGKNNQLVVLKEEDLDSESFNEVINCSAQTASRILELAKPAIEA